MYSVEDSYSFERLKDEVDNAAKFIDPEEFVWVLVGHKSDLDCDIAEETIAAWAAQLGTKLNFFASSKTGENVVQLFDKVVSSVHKVRRGRPARQYGQSYKGQVHDLSKPQITSTSDSSKFSGCSC
jgi:GTPase SAR1 family protein